MSKNIIISLTAQKRLLRDVCDMIRKPLTDHGIYYVHDEDNILKGYAMLVGPKDTCYEDGMYFFSFIFPHDYPFKPPVLTFHTRNGITRFHPNLYRNGKVCLSLLNTWRGEQWTSTQTIRSVLLTLITLFNENPLTNEPGFNKDNPSCRPYRKSIEYMNYKTAIMNMINQKSLPSQFIGFFPFIKEIILKRKEQILERLEKLSISKKKKSSHYVRVYSMTTNIDYSQLQKEMILAISNVCKN